MKKLLILFIVLFAYNVYAITPDDLKDHRYIQGEVQRDTDGTIIRNPKVIKAFKMIHPCPYTGLTTGVCPDWQINHIIPLACGGRDAVDNMGWFPDSIKTCPDPHCIDRYERKIYSHVPEIKGAINCKPEIVK